MTAGTVEPIVKQEQWPSVGRVVHLHTWDHHCAAALVAKVWDEPDGVSAHADLNLSVSSPESGNVHGQVRVPFGTTAGTWHWPQYVGPNVGPALQGCRLNTEDPE